MDKKIEGIYNHLNRLLIKRDLSNSSDRSLLRLKKLAKSGNALSAVESG
ncbi:MAG: hypothetical protein ACLRMZ_14320 [Blautia marasmi]